METTEIFEDIKFERQRQDDKWGANRTQHLFVWNTILMEEVGEVAEAALDSQFGGESTEHLREELIQVAAVAVAYIEDLDRRTNG